MQINENQIEAIKNDSVDLISEVNTIEVNSNEDYERGTASMIDGKKALKYIEDERKKITQPLAVATREINAKFKAISEPIETAYGTLKTKMVKYVTEQQRIAEEEAAKIRAEQEKLDKEQEQIIAKAKAKEDALRAKAEAETSAKKKAELEAKVEAQKELQGEARSVMANNSLEPVEDPSTIVRSGSGSSSTKKIRKVRVIDFAKLPDEYKTSNDVLIRKDALAGADIAGVEVYEELDISVRT